MKVSDVLPDKLKQFEGIGLRRIGVLPWGGMEIFMVKYKVQQ